MSDISGLTAPGPTGYKQIENVIDLYCASAGCYSLLCRWGRATLKRQTLLPGRSFPGISTVLNAICGDNVEAANYTKIAKVSYRGGSTVVLHRTVGFCENDILVSLDYCVV